MYWLKLRILNSAEQLKLPTGWLIINHKLMESSKNEGKKGAGADEIREISEKHINTVPNGDSVPDMPATGGKQFVNDSKKEGGDGKAEDKAAELKP